jgi:hypothetical protein
MLKTICLFIALFIIVVQAKEDEAALFKYAIVVKGIDGKPLKEVEVNCQVIVDKKRIVDTAGSTDENGRFVSSRFKVKPLKDLDCYKVTANIDVSKKGYYKQLYGEETCLKRDDYVHEAELELIKPEDFLSKNIKFKEEGEKENFIKFINDIYVEKSLNRFSAKDIEQLNSAEPNFDEPPLYAIIKPASIIKKSYKKSKILELGFQGEIYDQEITPIQAGKFIFDTNVEEALDYLIHYFREDKDISVFYLDVHLNRKDLKKRLNAGFDYEFLLPKQKALDYKNKKIDYTAFLEAVEIKLDGKHIRIN